MAKVPFEVVGLDFDNGTEFLNKAVIAWAGKQQIFFTRSRPYKKNDQATIESKNGHLVRKYAFYYRYDTVEERAVLNRLWPLVNDRLNYLTPTIKPTGYGSDRNGVRKRLYDKPSTPLDRLILSGTLAPGQVKRAGRLPRKPQPRPTRPRHRRPPGSPDETGQGQDRTALPRQLPARPARHPQRHQDQGLLTTCFAGSSNLRHGSGFAGTCI